MQIRAEAPKDPVAWFQAVLSRDLHPLRVELESVDEPFHSVIDTSQIAGISVTRSFANSPLTAHWHRPKPARAANYMLSYQEQGQTRHYTRDGDVDSPTDSFVLLRPGSELATQQDAAACAVLMLIPGLLLESQIRCLGLACLRPVPAASGVARVLRELVRQIVRQAGQLRPIDQSALAASLTWLMGSVFAESQDEERPEGAAQSHFRRISDAIEMNFRDGEYTSRSAANDLGMSQRYVQIVLRKFGTSFQTLLLERRLAESYELLKNWPQRANPVTDAAFCCGFNELSHFSRSFSKKYGVSPRAFREKVMKAHCVS